MSETPEKKAKPPKKKKTLPANCAHCNKRIRRKNWYYRNGRYFCGKGCSRQFAAKEFAEKTKAQAAAGKSDEPAPTAPAS